MICRREITIASSIAALTFLAAIAHAQTNGVTAGELVVEPPTLISLGFEWYVDGDANRNASVAVEYRREGLPPVAHAACRCCGSMPSGRSTARRWTTPRRTCSPAACSTSRRTRDYEVRLTLTDADGVAGDAQRIVDGPRTRARSRKPSAGGRVYHVYPPGFAGAKQEPAFMGLLAAYYMTALGGDWSRASPPRVEPGDTILVHAGVYKDFDRSELQPRDPVRLHDLLRHAVGRHLLPDAERHSRTSRSRSRRPGTAR